MNSHLPDLEEKLRAANKFWMYETRMAGKSLTEEELIEIAEAVLQAPKQWAQGFAEEFQGRKYPPRYEEDDDEE